jgi:Uma2 family endonuclease
VTIETSGQRPRTSYEPPLVSFEAFLDWLDEDKRAEWVDGEITEMAPVNLGHQDILRFLFLWIGVFVDRHRLGRLYMPPTLMHLAGRPSGREPDLLFIANEHLHRRTRNFIEGPGDLVVEIVSPDSVVRDNRDKLAEYEGAGVPEYWIVDELKHEARFYVLGETGRYQRAPVSADGIYTSTVLPALRLRVDWLWRDPPPTIEEALADLPE